MAAAALTPGEAGNPAEPQNADSFRQIRSYNQFLMAFSSWKDEVKNKYIEAQRVYVINEKLELEPKNSDGDVKEELVRRLFTSIAYDSPKNNFCVVHDHTFYGVMFNPDKLDQLETYVKFNAPTRNQKLNKLKEFNSEHDFIALHPTEGIIFIEVSGTEHLTVKTIEKKQGQLTKGRDLMKIFVRQMMNSDQQERQENLEDKLDRFFKRHPIFCLFPCCNRPTEKHLVLKLDEFTTNNGTRFFFREDLHRLVSNIKESFAGCDDCTIEEEFRRDVYRISLQCCITSSRSIERPFSKSVKDVNEEMERIFLSSKQYELVNSTESFKFIGGPAGTGKTVIAIQKVKTILGDIVTSKAWTEKIFFLAKTKENADSIRQEIANSFANYSGNLTDVLHVLHFQDFLEDFRPLDSLISEYKHIFIDDFENMIIYLISSSNFFSDFQSKNTKYEFQSDISRHVVPAFEFQQSEFLTDLGKYWEESSGKSNRYFWIFCDPDQGYHHRSIPWEMTDELPVIFRTSYRIAQLYRSEFMCFYKFKSRVEYGRCFAGSDVEFLFFEPGQTEKKQTGKKQTEKKQTKKFYDLLKPTLEKLKEQYGDNVAVIQNSIYPELRGLYEGLKTPHLKVADVVGREFDAVVYISVDRLFMGWLESLPLSRARLKLIIICSRKNYASVRESYIRGSSILLPLSTTDGEVNQKQEKKNEEKKKKTEETHQT